ncbi:dephospho-CoA kinase [Pseudopelagicola sp. nBUS_19]|uniref:dephospho-CoA kinase n=1 Tax=Pseudopelagicola sp. nBUS_19 TaxID=3395316 RepID=UPI003EB6B289
MPFSVGLTGSIGMGKSTTAALFADAGCEVWDADAVVHKLYSRDGAAVPAIAKAIPEAVKDGAVSREVLKKILQYDPSILKKLEDIVHPLVAQDRKQFLALSASDIIVFDIPLLFESNGNQKMDAVVCVSVSPDIQRQRALSRGTMDLKQYDTILRKQIPNSEKCDRSDFVIHTDTIEHAREQVTEVIEEIKKRIIDA